MHAYTKFKRDCESKIERERERESEGGREGGRGGGEGREGGREGGKERERERKFRGGLIGTYRGTGTLLTPKGASPTDRREPGG